MCGIVAIFNYLDSSKVDKSELLRISDSMKSRGPDDSGVWIEDGIGLAHRRLSIIDVSKSGHQPMTLLDNSLRIVFNGEIYNYKEIRKNLEKKGFVFFTNSDTEVLLNLYKYKGRKMVDDIRGMYAFAIWDKNLRGLFLARDPYGIKPLYYSDNGKVIRIASQVKSLLAANTIDKKYNPAGLVGFYLLGSIPEPFTMYEHIKPLRAGSVLWIDHRGVYEESFFSISKLLARPYVNTHDDTESNTKELTEILSESISAHLISDVPVGVFLSGGLDSATLTAHASSCIDKIETITLGFKELQGSVNDETLLAESLAKYYKTEHNTIWIGRDDFRDEESKIFSAMDQPSIDGINTYFVSKAASELGLKVALSGIGGDEIFAGYPSFKQIPSIVNKLKIFKKSQFIGEAFRYISNPIFKKFSSTKYAGMLEYGHSYGGAYLLRRGLYMPWELYEVLDPEIVNEGLKRLGLISRFEGCMNNIDNERLKITALESTWYMKNQLLRDSDWAGMAHSLEIRTPLVDIKLLEKLIPLMHSSHPPGKINMANTGEKKIPNHILNRKKTGFTVPVNKWISENKGNKGNNLKGWAEYILTEKFGIDAKG